MSRAWRPVLAIKNSRSFGALRGLSLSARGGQRPATVVNGPVRFGFDANGVFQIEVLTRDEP